MGNIVIGMIIGAGLLLVVAYLVETMLAKGAISKFAQKFDGELLPDKGEGYYASFFVKRIAMTMHAMENAPDSDLGGSTVTCMLDSEGPTFVVGEGSFNALGLARKLGCAVTIANQHSQLSSLTHVAMAKPDVDLESLLSTYMINSHNNNPDLLVICDGKQLTVRHYGTSIKLANLVNMANIAGLYAEALGVSESVYLSTDKLIESSLEQDKTPSQNPEHDRRDDFLNSLPQSERAVDFSRKSKDKKSW